MIIFSNLDATGSKDLEQNELDWILHSISFVNKWVNKDVQNKIAELIADCDEDFDGVYTIKETQNAFIGLLKAVNKHTGACSGGHKTFDLTKKIINHFKLIMKNYDVSDTERTATLANKKVATEKELATTSKAVAANRASPTPIPANPTKCHGLIPNFNASLDTRHLWAEYQKQ